MLEIKNIGFEVLDEKGKKKKILEDISLTVEDNSCVVLTGPNGSGKSTLAKIIMGIERATCGKILYNGEDITNYDVTKRALLGIGFAFQQPVKFKGLTVFDLLRLSAGKDFSTDGACEYLSEVGLCALNYVNRELNSSLSGGELKRIEIAMLLARRTKLSLFDEPEAGIDLWSFKSLIKVFHNIRHKNGGSIVIISHQERILDIADKIVVLKNGGILEQGSKSEILKKLPVAIDSCKYFKEAANNE